MFMASILLLFTETEAYRHFITMVLANWTASFALLFWYGLGDIISHLPSHSVSDTRQRKYGRHEARNNWRRARRAAPVYH